MRTSMLADLARAGSGGRHGSSGSSRRAGRDRGVPGRRLRATTSTVRMSSRTCVTGTPVSRNCSCSPASAGCQADQPQAVLIEDEMDRRRRARPSPGSPDGCADWRASPPGPRRRCRARPGGIGSHDAERRPGSGSKGRTRAASTRRRASGARPSAICSRSRSLERFARLGVGRQHDDLGEGRIGQLRIVGRGRSAARPGRYSW